MKKGYEERNAMSREIGKMIREMRKAAGMSQMQLADKIGVSYQQVQKYEKGASKLNVPRLLQIAEIFSVPVMTFLEEPKTKVAEMHIPYQSLTDEEARLLMLFRRLKRRKLKDTFTEMLKDIVKLSESSE
jgi:transcriptional regulator with XRE-family HTH domain